MKKSYIILLLFVLLIMVGLLVWKYWPDNSSNRQKVTVLLPNNIMFNKNTLSDVAQDFNADNPDYNLCFIYTDKAKDNSLTYYNDKVAKVLLEGKENVDLFLFCDVMPGDKDKVIPYFATDLDQYIYDFHSGYFYLAINKDSLHTDIAADVAELILREQRFLGGEPWERNLDKKYR